MHTAEKQTPAVTITYRVSNKQCAFVSFFNLKSFTCLSVVIKMVQDLVIPSHHVLSLPIVAAKPSAKLNPKSKKMQKQRKAIKQDKTIKFRQ